MRKCSEECIPCCDYCKHVVHEVIEVENGKVVGGPIFCKLHLDTKHTQLARACGSCKDFWCMDSDKDIVEVELNKEDEYEKDNVAKDLFFLWLLALL